VYKRKANFTCLAILQK